MGLSLAKGCYNDPLRNSYTVQYQDGTSRTVAYDCCGLSTVSERDGSLTQYIYDSLKRQVATRVFSDPPVTTTNALNAAGKVVRTAKLAGALDITTWQGQYDDSGRLTWETNALNGITGHSYWIDTAGRPGTTATSYPGGAQRNEIRNIDGSLYEISGSATQPVRYTYSDNPYYSGSTTTTRLVNGGPGEESVTEIRDALGRVTQTSYSFWANARKRGQASIFRISVDKAILTLAKFNHAAPSTPPV